MSDEKKYTERELVLAKREAYVAGVADKLRHIHGSAHSAFASYTRTSTGHDDRADANAKRLYHLPKRVVPRVVKDVPGWHGYQFRVVGGVFEVRYLDNGVWAVVTMTTRGGYEFLGPVYASLLANPTEEVDDA